MSVVCEKVVTLHDVARAYPPLREYLQSRDSMHLSQHEVVTEILDEPVDSITRALLTDLLVESVDIETACQRLSGATQALDNVASYLSAVNGEIVE